MLTMLEHQKLVLENLSSDKDLFRKELLKSLGWLKSYEVFELYKWVKSKYYDRHKDVINDVFTSVRA
jgi:hypothetical protein